MPPDRSTCTSSGAREVPVPSLPIPRAAPAVIQESGYPRKPVLLFVQSPPTICIVSWAGPDSRVNASQSMVSVNGELIESFDLL